MNIEDVRPPDAQAREYNLLCLLQRVWTSGYTTKSDFARDWADEIAEAASRGHLTTLVAFQPNTRTCIYGRLWKVTPSGLAFLSLRGHVIADKEVKAYVEEYTKEDAQKP